MDPKNQSYGEILKRFFFQSMCLLLLAQVSCTPNHPYPEDERGKPIYYTDFTEAPKHLDPAISYSSDEYEILETVYEPPFQYHFLKRPYELQPLTAEAIPSPEYIDDQGKKLPTDVDLNQVDKIIYTLKIKKGILYQNHPCFVKTKWSKEELEDIEQISEFPQNATRELVALDYVNQIKRLADPRIHCPILSIMAKYIDGLQELSEALKKDLEKERNDRRIAQGVTYSQEKDERENPIILDLNKHPFPGVKLLDDHSYQIVLKKAYPQILYWLAMPFFAPMPQEAMDFFAQGSMVEKGFTLDRCPIGTGPYQLEKFNPDSKIVLVANENFHEEFYPSEGEKGDEEKGLLKDKGKKLPFLKKVIFHREKQTVPMWNKFLQGYYDSSGISSDSFEQAIQISAQGNVETSGLLQSRKIRLAVSTAPTVWYIAFNMADSVVGGYTEEQKKLRQAFSIAIDVEEYIQIFANGRGLVSHSPLPPGIYGYENGEKEINTISHTWDDKKNAAKRKNLDIAKKLLAEAGYPNGKDKEGRPLTIRFVNSWNDSGGGLRVAWFAKQFAKLNVNMKNETSDYNRFREKMDQGNYQFTMWGWNADYPDPENFLFLLYGPNSRMKYKGENVSNYNSPEFNKLFKQMETMPKGQKRLDIITQMKKLYREECPWIGGYYPVSYGLYHEWYGNAKSHAMYRGALKFKKIDHILREEKREEWNKPKYWPVAIVLVLLVVGTIPALNTVRRRGKATA